MFWCRSAAISDVNCRVLKYQNYKYIFLSEKFVLKQILVIGLYIYFYSSLY